MKTKNEAKGGRCIFRPKGVVCFETDMKVCAKCGWNPEEEERRKEKIKEKLHEK